MQGLLKLGAFSLLLILCPSIQVINAMEEKSLVDQLQQLSKKEISKLSLCISEYKILPSFCIDLPELYNKSMQSLRSKCLKILDPHGISMQTFDTLEDALTELAQRDEKSPCCDISGLDLSEVILALYNNALVNNQVAARTPGWFGAEIFKQQISTIIQKQGCDYINGRRLSILILDGGHTIMVNLYNRNNGPGLAQKVIQKLRNQAK